MAEPEKLPSIYGLYDATGALRYIGKANVPRERLKRHMRDSARLRTPLYAWIRKHGIPEMRVIESDCADWREAERRLIADARSRGERLLNLADGGDEPSCPIEVRRANGRKSRHNPECIATRSRNGRALNARIEADPFLRRLVEIKRMVADGLRKGCISEATKAKFRRCAQLQPDLFGCWANI